MLKSDEIKVLFAQFENASAEFEGVECWSARELQKLLGYTLWQNFEKVLTKSKIACENVGENVCNHFIDVNKMVEIGSGAHKQIKDILLTRYACYLVAQNGDSQKSQIAFAQSYFAVQTRRAEIIEQRIRDNILVDRGIYVKPKSRRDDILSHRKIPYIGKMLRTYGTLFCLENSIFYQYLIPNGIEIKLLKFNIL